MGSSRARSRSAWYAMSSELYQRRYMNPHFSDDGADWVEWVRRRIAARGPVDRCLVLGCGLGDGLLDFHRRGIARRLHGVDLSETAIADARNRAEREGLGDRVTFEVGDFDRCDLRPGGHDVVFMVMSLHHAQDLDLTLGRAREALKPGGWFVANEYVGPNRWQHTYVQLLFIKALLTLIPRGLRRRPDGTVKGRIGRPTIEWMLATDPSEAVHSEEIPEAIERHFRLERRVDYGGGISVPVLDEIVGNFRSDDERAMRWFRRITRVDGLALKWGLVPSANAVFLAQRPEQSTA